MNIPTATTTESVAVFKGVNVSVGGLALRNLSVWGDDLQPTGAQLGRPLRLVLGAEAFRAALVDIDFESHRIAFHNPKTFHIPPGFDRLVLRARESNGIPTTMVSIEGRAPVSAIFDLGSGSRWPYPALTSNHSIF